MAEKKVTVVMDVVAPQAAAMAAALKDISKEFESAEEHLAKIKEMMSPENLQRSVKIEIETEAAEKKLKELKEAERHKQLGTTPEPPKPESAIKAPKPKTEEGEGAMGGMGAALAAVAGPAAAIAGIAASIVSLVGKANPAALDRFMTALDDLQATVGAALMPILELMTEQVRMFGDVLASILPSADEMREVLAPIREYMAAVRDVLADFAPIIKGVLIVALKALQYALYAIYWPIKKVLEALHWVLGLLGLGGGGLKSSVGAAGGTASMVDLSELGKQAQLAAFGAATAGEAAGKSNLDQIAENTKLALDFFKDIVSLLGKPAQIATDAIAKAPTLTPEGLAIGVARGLFGF